jgi:hypothetical protein
MSGSRGTTQAQLAHVLPMIFNTQKRKNAGQIANRMRLTSNKMRKYVQEDLQANDLYLPHEFTLQISKAYEMAESLNNTIVKNRNTFKLLKASSGRDCEFDNMSAKLSPRGKELIVKIYDEFMELDNHLINWVFLDPNDLETFLKTDKVLCKYIRNTIEYMQFIGSKVQYEPSTCEEIIYMFAVVDVYKHQLRCAVDKIEERMSLHRYDLKPNTNKPRNNANNKQYA